MKIQIRLKHIVTDHLSFPLVHEVDKIGIFALLEFEDKLDKERNPFNFVSKHYAKYKFASKLTGLVTVSN